MTSLEDIKSLREKTGASLQACKKALDENSGDETSAIEHLRKLGEAKAAKRSDRDTSQGVIATAINENTALILKLGCETDFVAKNPDFVEAAEQLAQEFLTNGKDFQTDEIVNEIGLKMGEKIELNEVQFLEDATFGGYIHSNKKVGTIVALNGGTEEMAKDIAMHATAMQPLVISPDEVDSALVEKEREIWTEQLKNEGKPEEILDKILMGKEAKFRGENALLKQDFVKDSEKTIEQFLGDATIKGFVRLGN
ncbi:translation elongation factor Ts [Candidatus Peregrinibacteria bacterium]|jgi:elongation factor Ts|nr:translation elongation factor Ts [Candidatus Peregrinibacteria bacterium]MBT7702653.1 translation elongation factor Ts [Candidatus Peregrinibacteria bacterium]